MDLTYEGLAKVIGIVRDLAASDPVREDTDDLGNLTGVFYCSSCGSDLQSNPSYPAIGIHEPDCAWRRAKDFMGDVDDRPSVFAASVPQDSEPTQVLKRTQW